MHQRLFSGQGSLGEVCLHAVNYWMLFPMLQRAEPLWYQADSPELLQGSFVLLADKDKWMAGCSFLCSLSQATGSFWWYLIYRLRQVQDSSFNNSHPPRQESGLAGKRNLQRIDWKRLLHSILMSTDKYSCLCYFPIIQPSPFEIIDTWCTLVFGGWSLNKSANRSRHTPVVQPRWWQSVQLIQSRCWQHFVEEVKIQTWYSWPAGQCTPAMKKIIIWWFWVIGTLGEIAPLI